MCFSSMVAYFSASRSSLYIHGIYSFVKEKWRPLSCYTVNGVSDILTSFTIKLTLSDLLADIQIVNCSFNFSWFFFKSDSDSDSLKGIPGHHAYFRFTFSFTFRLTLI